MDASNCFPASSEDLAKPPMATVPSPMPAARAMPAFLAAPDAKEAKDFEKPLPARSPAFAPSDSMPLVAPLAASAMAFPALPSDFATMVT